MTDTLSPPHTAARGLGRFSIRALMVCLVLVVALPAAGLVAWLFDEMVRQEERAAVTRVRELASNMNAMLDLTLRDRLSGLERLASRPQLRSLDSARFDPMVSVYLGAPAEFDNLQINHADGSPLYSQHTEMRALPLVMAAPDTPAGGTPSASVSDLRQQSATGRWVALLTVPVRNARGQVNAHLSLALDLQNLNQRVMAQVPPSAIIGVVDRNEHYLLRSLAPETYIGMRGPQRVITDTQAQDSGTLTATGPDGITRVYAFETMARTGWRVVAGLPADEVYGNARRVRQLGMSVGGAMVLLALLVAWLAGRGVVRPIHALARAVDRIGQGDTQARAPVHGPREVQTVAQQFNHMADARQSAEAALRHSENDLAITLQSIGDAVIATDLQGRVVRMNPTAERLTGWPLDSARGRPMGEVFRIVHATTRDPAEDPVQKVLRTHSVVALANHTALLARGGQEYHIADSAAPIRDADGATLGVVLVFSDVSEAYRVQKELRASLEVLRLRDRALAEVSQGVLIADPSVRLTWVNPGFERLTGYRADEVLGRTPMFLQNPLTDPAVAAALRDALRKGEGFDGEILNCRKDGSPLWLAINVSPLHDEHGDLSGFVCAQRDITAHKHAEAERQALEAQLRESQKMESIGTLAGGIAHDFNNLLGAILGHTALACSDLGPTHPAQQNLAQIRRASERARELVQQILAFSRRQPHALVVQAARPIVEETMALLRATLPAMVALRSQLDAQPLHIHADATQLQQVLMNLGTNAAHALADRPRHPLGTPHRQAGGRADGADADGSNAAPTPAAEGGWIELGLDSQPPLSAAPSTDTRTLGTMPAGPCVHLWVRDNGSGMDEATCARIFEPFFTTKPVGTGTGLGLSVAHGIIQSHHGAIAVRSQPGLGTTVHLYLPACEAPGTDALDPAADDGAPTPPAPATVVQGHGERVLYVDDDEVMRAMVERILLRAGWAPTCADGEASARALLAEAEPPFDVLVSDYNMPGSSGLDLARAVMQDHPGLPIVMASGYLSEALRSGAEALGLRHLVRKQNLFEELAPTVQRALDENRGH